MGRQWAAVIVLVLCVRLDLHRGVTAGWDVTCLLVFGDSSVDPGNNNRLATGFKANFPPYGRDFFHALPTGRFSNGRLPTDFIAEALGVGMAIPAFLDPDLKPEQLPRGASFASASSGYDDLTAELGYAPSQDGVMESAVTNSNGVSRAHRQREQLLNGRYPRDIFHSPI